MNANTTAETFEHCDEVLAAVVVRLSNDSTVTKAAVDGLAKKKNDGEEGIYTVESKYHLKETIMERHASRTQFSREQTRWYDPSSMKMSPVLGFMLLRSCAMNFLGEEGNRKQSS